jgi:hypothetical protein
MSVVSSLTALIPRPITDAQLISCSVAEPDPNRVMRDGTVGEVAWVSGTTYAAGTRVVRLNVHRVFRRTAVTGLATALPESSPLLWVDEGPTNRWAWADGLVATRIEGASPLTLTVRPGVFTDIEFYGLSNVDLVTVSVLDSPAGSEVFRLETSTDEYASSDPHWSFYFDGPMQGQTLAVPDVPLYPEAQVTVTLASYNGQPVGAGLIAFGSFEELGLPQFGFEAVYRDFSFEEVDAWGNVTRRPGLKGKDLRGSCILDTPLANGVDATVRRLLDVGAVFSVSQAPQYRFLKTWGQIRPARMQAADTHVVVEIEVEGRI